jgi:uncharacterized membrane protein
LCNLIPCHDLSGNFYCWFVALSIFSICSVIVTYIIFFIVQYEQKKNQLKVAESAIEDLKNRLDDAMNAEDMLEQLTEKDLAQGEVIN